ncbi:WxL domain-containing protein [Enterococcus crotali]|uniref:WxL domain-containing protein n=1 Tax=Enterococcus crotali TaxID=1453587 RepID=UPI00046E7FE2|nr:WxL domain-containing protein [Enterococcus crotali]
MKKRTLCSIALLAALGANVLLPAAASADNGKATQANGQGTIDYVEDSGKNTDKDPEKPTDPVTPPYTPNPDDGPLKIDGVSDMNFKQQSAVLTDENYFAEQVEIDKNGTKEKRGVYLQLTDKRIDSRGKWALRASMTQQFKAASGNVLNNATISFKNPIVETETDAAVSPHAVLASTGSVFELLETGNVVDVLETKDAKDGFGTYTVAFGNTVEYNTNTGKGTAEDSTGVPNATNKNKIENGSVSLFVPGKTVKTKEAHTATVLWEIAEVL